MTTEKCMTKASVFCVLAFALGALVSWKYCGFELMGLACYYLMRAIWHDITSD